MKPIYWIPLAVLLAVVLFFVISYTNPPSPSRHTAGPPLARRAEKAVQLGSAQQHARAKADTIGAAAATAAAKQSHAAAHSLRQQVLTFHHQSRRHASPAPTTDTAVARLQSALVAYVIILTFAAWAGLSYPIYRLIAPWAVVVYGVVSLLARLIWAGTRKGSTIKREA